MRILFVHNGADLYGASRSLLRLSSRLVKDGNEVLVIIPYDGVLRSKLEENGVKVKIILGLPVIDRQKYKTIIGLVAVLLQIPRFVIKMRHLVRNFRPRIIHTNSSVIFASGIVAKLCRLPHIWHIREHYSEFPKLWKYYQWYMYYFSDVIVCVSASVAEQFDKRIVKNKIEVIHNGFPKEEFLPVGEKRIKDFKERFKLNNHLTVGTVGRIKFKRKGQEVLVKAASLLKERFPNVKYLLIGSPFPGNEEHLANLKLLIMELKAEDYVIYTGDVEDIKAAYSAMDVFVLPSGLPEPFGGVVIESMAFGKPLVATRLGGTIEQVENERTGLLVEQNNPQKMADALERLLLDTEMRIRMGENGRERFLNLFEFESFYIKVLNLYKRVDER